MGAQLALVCILGDDYGVCEQKQLDWADRGTYRVVLGVPVPERKLVQEVALDEVVPRHAQLRGGATSETRARSSCVCGVKCWRDTAGTGTGGCMGSARHVHAKVHRRAGRRSNDKESLAGERQPTLYLTLLVVAKAKLQLFEDVDTLLVGDSSVDGTVRLLDALDDALKVRALGAAAVLHDRAQEQDVALNARWARQQ